MPSISIIGSRRGSGLRHRDKGKKQCYHALVVRAGPGETASRAAAGHVSVRYAGTAPNPWNQGRRPDNASRSGLAQLVEQLTVNQRVVGSSPTSGVSLRALWNMSFSQGSLFLILVYVHQLSTLRNAVTRRAFRCPRRPKTWPTASAARAEGVESGGIGAPTARRSLLRRGRWLHAWRHLRVHRHVAIGIRDNVEGQQHPLLWKARLRISGRVDDVRPGTVRRCCSCRRSARLGSIAQVPWRQDR